ncbi:hypothetical protein HRW14_24710 [Streptomyces lunaelactis]|uniref:DUF6571 family protein n=1 Tax=Streptomyces lunaelactis TaxID=1535768 RepID=UPI001585D168|nr:DUF6571 family protein [Streptomyces lunaelactis]NUK37278.1 hypothetical protein [Streptomyces lunaelactis]NUK43948.1 hypothetical protein [Streptomyces lunaelactis]NUK53418.1 hypothetical protein [Streptomyces lunaelactis]NUK67105.1 hypothetical protein [Streptomyces lunaelactis]NUK94533.1 hypothetical protein [Streptomyces lunaelactis]
MDFEALHSANFKMLDDTVTDWTSMLTKLKELEKDAREGLRGKALKANWSGYNATVSREFIGKTSGEFADAHTQATSIRDIMTDTRDELKTQQRLLKEAVERGRGKHLTVTAKGDAFTVEENPDSKSSTGQKDVNELRNELQGILDKATEIDSTAATSLKALVDLTDLGFSDAVYKDRDSAAAAVKEAEELAALAKKDPEDLTVKEFDRLNAGLQKYSGDQIFAEHFAEKLTAKGTLEFWAGINDPAKNRDLFPERREQFDDLQKNLSLTLATATQADTPDMSKWKYEMTDLGSQPVHKNSTTQGFQVMSNLMRWGNFEDRFLNDYGTELMKTEKAASSNGRHTPTLWMHMGMDPNLNRTGTDSGSDPMIGFLKALSNSPDAATDFFNSDFVTKDEDHDFKTKDKDGKEVKDELSNFDYLFEERDWPPEMDSELEDSIEGRNNLALALEAATTGHPAGELPTVDTPPHNAEQTKLMEGLVQSISEDNTRLTDRGYMSDSIGQIASEYLPDINRATTDTNPSDDATPTEKEARARIEKLFPVAGSEAVMDHRDVSRFLLTIGQDPEGYAAVEVSQKAYMANLMDHHLNPDLPADQRYSENKQLLVGEIAHASGEVSGTLNVGRQEAVAGPADEADKKYEQSVAQWKNGVSGGIGTGIGVGVSFIASPVVGAAVGGGASTVSGMILEELFQDAEGKAKDEAGGKMGEDWENGLDSNIKYTQTAAAEAAKAHHLPDSGDIAEWARTGARDGYQHGGDFSGRVAPELTTDI